MSHVSSYMFINHHNSEGIDLIREKLQEMWNDKHDDSDAGLFPFVDADIKSTGSKVPYFGTVYCVGLNYWSDEYFQDWLQLHRHKLHHIEVYFRGEDDDHMTPVLEYKD